MHPDEKQLQAVLFLRNAVAYYARLGITVQRLPTDSGPAFRSCGFCSACIELGIKHSFTRPYRLQTNGKAERFIQSALREWAYGCRGIKLRRRSSRLLQLPLSENRRRCHRT